MKILMNGLKLKERKQMEREKITWWTIKMSWNNGDEEYLSDIPNWVAKPVDGYRETLEEKEANEE